MPNPVLERILKEGTVSDDYGNVRPLGVNISREEGEFLQRIIRELRPSVTFEVGLAYGVSTLYICQALREVGGRRHIVCDPDQFGGIGAGFAGIGLKNVRDAGYEDLVEFHGVSSHALLPELERRGERIGFAFVDGWHTFDYTFVEFFYIDRILSPGGVIAFDDVHYPGVRSVCRYVLRNRAYGLHAGPDRSPSARRRAVSLLRHLPLANRLLRDDVRCPDHSLGLNGQYVALRKLHDDVLGDGKDGSRRWDQHADF